MASVRKAQVAAYRERMKRRGLVRIEVQVRKEDIPLLRNVATALSDPKRETSARAILSQRFAPIEPLSLKALLAAAPLDGIDLERSRETGRSVDL